MSIVLFKPTLQDIQAMQKLVQNDVLNGNILQRDPNEMATTIRSYTCVKDDDEIIGFVALHIYTTSLAEIRSLIVDKNYRNKGIAKQLISSVIKEAAQYKLNKLLVLTYKKELFESFGFKEIAKETIPETKIWADCIKCKHFPICDEISLTLDI
jgi:amino-acid N-acetyltransferase